MHPAESWRRPPTNIFYNAREKPPNGANLKQYTKEQTHTRPNLLRSEQPEKYNKSIGKKWQPTGNGDGITSANEAQKGIDMAKKDAWKSEQFRAFATALPIKAPRTVSWDEAGVIAEREARDQRNREAWDALTAEDARRNEKTQQTMELLDKTTRTEREAMEREIEAAEQEHARHLNAIRARYRARNGLQGWNEDATSDRETWQNLARNLVNE